MTDERVTSIPSGLLVPRATMPGAAEALIVVCSAAAGLIIAAPVWLGAWWLLGPRWAALLVLGWLGLGALFLIPWLSNTIAPPIARLRTADNPERKQLWQALVRVCVACGDDPENYRLFVMHGRSNACSAGRDAIGVTEELLRHPTALDGIELEALIAHEVGHHRHGDLLLSGPTWWYLLPLRVVDVVAWALTSVPLVGSALGRLLFVALSIVLFPFTFVSGLASRPREFLADRFAVDCGYGLPLGFVLERMLALQGPRQVSLIRAFAQSHPPTHVRLARLREAEVDAVDTFGFGERT
jgi:STE24 endopeptidase